MSNTNAPGSQGRAIPRNLYGYDVIDFIGEGAASVIYAVSDPESGQLWALKYVQVKNDKQMRFFEQLQNEFEVSKRVNHPKLRRAVEMKVNRTFLRKVTEGVLLMELFDGVPLDRRPPTSIGKIIDVFIQTAQGLEALHATGFVHCDLKPNNILLGAKGDVKVIDLGQACPILTVKKRIQGTPDFISPEQVRCEPVTPRTDVFNFGATMYWALTGKNVPTLFNLKKSENSFLVDDYVTTPQQINAKVPETLSNLVMECVRSNASKRPADMTELVRRLEIMASVNARQSKSESRSA